MSAVISGVSKVVIEVDNQDRARMFWTGTMGCELVQDTPYGEGERWLEVRTPDGNTVLVLGLRQGEARSAPPALPSSSVFFACDDLQATYEELSQRGVEFPQPPAKMGFGWWSLFADPEGNQFALVPRGQ